MAMKVDRFCPFCGAMISPVAGGVESGNGWYLDGSGPDANIREQLTLLVECPHADGDCGAPIGAKLVVLDLSKIAPNAMRELYAAHMEKTGSADAFDPRPGDVYLEDNLPQGPGVVRSEDFNEGKTGKRGKPLSKRMRKRMTQMVSWSIHCHCGCDQSSNDLIFEVSAWVHEFSDHEDYWRELNAALDLDLIEYEG